MHIGAGGKQDAEKKVRRYTLRAQERPIYGDRP